MTPLLFIDPRLCHHCLPCNMLITSHKNMNQMAEGNTNLSQQSIVVCVFELVTVVDKSVQAVRL